MQCVAKLIIVCFFVCIFFFFAIEIDSIYGEVSHFKQPDGDGKIKFFPRIVGGRRAHEDEFNGIVSVIILRWSVKEFVHKTK